VSEGLTVNELEVWFGATKALGGVSLRVQPGEILALLGPSGSGKSTLLRAVAGLETAKAGRIAWDGDGIGGVPVHRRGFGLLFQDGQLFTHMDVAANVAYGLPRGRAAAAARRERVAELLRLVGLDGFGRRDVRTLSGGEQQRVALARALAPRPRLLLLDEPLSALDAALRRRLAEDMRRIIHAAGLAAVFVTHDTAEAFAVADIVAVLVAGRVAQIGQPVDLWRRPTGETVARLLGCRWFVDGRLARGDPTRLRTELGEVDVPWLAGVPAVGGAATQGGRPGQSGRPGRDAASRAEPDAAEQAVVRVGLRPGTVRIGADNPRLAGSEVRITPTGPVARLALSEVGELEATVVPGAAGLGLDPRTMAILAPAVRPAE
jgi:thiamine transport system ATP-binding protein